MCKGMTVIPVDRVVDKKESEKWRAEDEERHKGVADNPPPTPKNIVSGYFANEQNPYCLCQAPSPACIILVPVGVLPVKDNFETPCK
jgi:hypothetical protein